MPCMVPTYVDSEGKMDEDVKKRISRALVRTGHRTFVEFYEEDGTLLATTLASFDQPADARWWVSKKFPNIIIGGGKG